MQLKKLLFEISTALLVLLFLYTAISKFLDFDVFRYEMNNQPFPNILTPFLVWLVPLAELAIVVCLLLDKTRLTGLYASLVIMSLFTIYTALVLLNVFEYVPCSCGGVIKQLKWPEHLVFNLFFVAISYTGIKLSKQQYRLQNISI